MDASLIYARRDVRSMEDFDAADLSVKDDFPALEESGYFVLLYRRRSSQVPSLRQEQPLS